MGRKRKTPEPGVLPDHESGVRSLIAQSRGEEHIAYRTLAETKGDPEGIVVFEGDYGGQIYLIARAGFIDCSEAQLQTLLSELDALAWDDPDGARLYYESQPVGAGISGGMGGGAVELEVWLHGDLRAHDSAVRAVLTGERKSIYQ